MFIEIRYTVVGIERTTAKINKLVFQQLSAYLSNEITMAVVTLTYFKRVVIRKCTKSKITNSEVRLININVCLIALYVDNNVLLKAILNVFSNTEVN